MMVGGKLRTAPAPPRERKDIAQRMRGATLRYICVAGGAGQSRMTFHEQSLSFEEKKG